MLRKCSTQSLASLVLKYLWVCQFLPKSRCAGHVTFIFCCLNYGKCHILWRHLFSWEGSSKSQDQLLIIIIPFMYVPGTDPSIVHHHGLWYSQPLHGMCAHTILISQIRKPRLKEVKWVTQGPQLACGGTSVQNQAVYEFRQSTNS